jgi:hypothetical protein
MNETYHEEVLMPPQVNGASSIKNDLIDTIQRHNSEYTYGELEKLPVESLKKIAKVIGATPPNSNQSQAGDDKLLPGVNQSYD